MSFFNRRRKPAMPSAMLSIIEQARNDMVQKRDFHQSRMNKLDGIALRIAAELAEHTRAFEALNNALYILDDDAPRSNPHILTKHGDLTELPAEPEYDFQLDEADLDFTPDPVADMDALTDDTIDARPLKPTPEELANAEPLQLPIEQADTPGVDKLVANTVPESKLSLEQPANRLTRRPKAAR